MDFQEYFEEFYSRYNVELIRAPEGFFYLRPRSTTLIPRSVLSELDMMVGKILCYLYLSPERLGERRDFYPARAVRRAANAGRRSEVTEAGEQPFNRF